MSVAPGKSEVNAAPDISQFRRWTGFGRRQLRKHGRNNWGLIRPPFAFGRPDAITRVNAGDW